MASWVAHCDPGQHPGRGSLSGQSPVYTALSPLDPMEEAERVAYQSRIQTPVGQPGALVTSYLYTSVALSGRWVARG